MGYSLIMTSNIFCCVYFVSIFPIVINLLRVHVKTIFYYDNNDKHSYIHILPFKILSFWRILLQHSIKIILFHLKKIKIKTLWKTWPTNSK